MENPKNETLTYFYQLNEEVEIEIEENTHTFTGLSDGKYKARGRAETLDGVILEEKELDVTIAYEQVYVSSSGNDETGNGSLENPYATLQPAYNKVKNKGEILLLSDIRATSTTNMNSVGKTVTLRSNDGNAYTIIKDPSFTAQILNITNSNTVTTTNITFDGNNVISNASLIEVYNYDSTLNLNVGTTIQNNNNRGRYYDEWNDSGAFGGGVYVYKSTLNINDANIQNNRTSAQSGTYSHGGGVAVYYGTLNLNSGFISNNKNDGSIVNQLGGGVMIFESTFNMNGGMIANNETKRSGGGIFISSSAVNSTMTMTGGTITNNTAVNGGGGICAYIEAGASTSTTVYMKGGTISNNSAATGVDIYKGNNAQIIDQR